MLSSPYSTHDPSAAKKDMDPYFSFVEDDHPDWTQIQELLVPNDNRPAIRAPNMCNRMFSFSQVYSALLSKSVVVPLIDKNELLCMYTSEKIVTE